MLSHPESKTACPICWFYRVYWKLCQMLHGYYSTIQQRFSLVFIVLPLAILFNGDRRTLILTLWFCEKERCFLDGSNWSTVFSRTSLLSNFEAPGSYQHYTTGAALAGRSDLLMILYLFFACIWQRCFNTDDFDLFSLESCLLGDALTNLFSQWLLSVTAGLAKWGFGRITSVNTEVC